MKNLLLILRKCKKQLKKFKVEWEPFYDEILEVIRTPTKEKDYFVGTTCKYLYVSNLTKVIRHIKRYFEPNCVEKLFEKLR